ncbi:MAG: hypothetical protein GX372_01545 [Ignavibacteria bacterium]|jgi:acyl-CoA reductase-like NAD-dependent aldehyde dehydrogenase|nr:hypothetical protein [Ignavibacteria bacterium]
MKLLKNVKTDDLSEEQKRQLSEMIAKEMMKKIENSMVQHSDGIIDVIKNMIQEDNEEN